MPYAIPGLDRLNHPRRWAAFGVSAAAALAVASGPTAIAATTAPQSVSRIHDIQGAAHLSPVAGEQVSDIPGVVTAVGRNGFWMQDTQPDDDPATSEAVFVYTRSQPTVARADTVTVSGTVYEYRPGGEATNLTTTEITDPSVTVTGSDAAPPAATQVGPGGRVAPAPVRTDQPGDVEQAGFDAAGNGLDFYESMEGMLVRVTDAVAAGPTNRYGELTVLPGGAGEPRTARGGIRYTYADPNTERVMLDDLLAETPSADTGDTLPGDVVGVLDYSFGNFKLQVLDTPGVQPGNLPRETTEPAGRGELAVATYNVENLDPGDPQRTFDRLARGIVDNLASPDIVALEEIQDNSGPDSDGTVAADRTYRKLIDAITTAGGPSYDYRQIDPQENADGGQPGGNIRVGFLFRTDRKVRFVDREPGDATTATEPIRVGGGVGLSHSPGRVEPTNTAWDDSRKPLAGEFRYRGERFIVVANHFNSKYGDQPLMGRYQPPARESEQQRHAQARVVRDFLDGIFAIDSGANVVVLGDINDFEFSETVDILLGNGSMVALARELPAEERYSYVYQGNSQILDQILLSGSLAGAYTCDIVHLNAEYAVQDSDHDPQVVRLAVSGRHRR